MGSNKCLHKFPFEGLLMSGLYSLGQLMKEASLTSFTSYEPYRSFVRHSQ